MVVVEAVAAGGNGGGANKERRRARIQLFPTRYFDDRCGTGVVKSSKVVGASPVPDRTTLVCPHQDRYDLPMF